MFTFYVSCIFLDLRVVYPSILVRIDDNIYLIAIALQGCFWGPTQGYHGLRGGGFGFHRLRWWQQVWAFALYHVGANITDYYGTLLCRILMGVHWFISRLLDFFECSPWFTCHLAVSTGRASSMPRLGLLWTTTSSSSSRGTTTSGATATVSLTWSATCSRPNRDFSAFHRIPMALVAVHPAACLCWE